MSSVRTVRALAIVSIASFLGACRESARDPARSIAGGDAELGRAAIRAYGCGTCHVIPGVRGARGHVGPPLTDFALRQYIAGAVPNEPAMLVRWIQNPQSIEPGTVMPPLGVNDADARHIAAYLYTLGAGRGLGPPHLFPERVLHP